MDELNKSIGIWGFGIVGKAAARHLYKQGKKFSIFDKRELTESERELIQSYNASFHRQTDPGSVIQWLENQAYILASPGVDIRPYDDSRTQFITELDLFFQSFKKPIIAVTGSVGKTTVTTLLSSLLRTKYTQLWTGGNIGTGMLDAIDSPADASLLELSSFQLDYCNQFAPYCAIWTNFYPNHIDRHGSLEGYFEAKKNILAHQKSDQYAIVPLSLRTKIGSIPSITYYVASDGDIIPDIIHDRMNVVYANHGIIFLRRSIGEIELGSIRDLPDITFVQNWLTISAALHALGIPLSAIKEQLHEPELPAHRLELVKTVDGIDFYDDSKGTTPAATLAAVNKLHAQGRAVILILGGLSKGLDRAPLIEQLKNKVSFIYCIGKEREQLASWCNVHAIAHSSLETLDEVINHFAREMKPNDQLLLSPAGSSFDQFKDYQERGDYFKKLIASIKN